MWRKWTYTGLLAMGLLLAGCAAQNPNTPVLSPSTPGLAGTEPADHLAFLDAYDPMEPLNRRIYMFNMVVDNNFIEPVIRTYKKVIPVFVRDRISNFFSNIGDLPVMVNCLLQAKSEKAGNVLGRMMVNTTVGILGLWDPATGMGLIKYNEDFGQTLAVYGVRPGPYIVLPILGPSTLRDTAGLVTDSFNKTVAVGLMDIDTLTDFTLTTVDGLETRASLPFSYGDFDSSFEYEMVRTLYLDMRSLLVHDGEFVKTHAAKPSPPH